MTDVPVPRVEIPGQQAMPLLEIDWARVRPATALGFTEYKVMELYDLHVDAKPGNDSATFTRDILEHLAPLLEAGCPDAAMIRATTSGVSLFRVHASHRLGFPFDEAIDMEAAGCPPYIGFSLRERGMSVNDLLACGVGPDDWENVGYLLSRFALTAADVARACRNLPRGYRLSHLTRWLSADDSAWAVVTAAILGACGHGPKKAAEAARKADGTPWADVFVMLASEGMSLPDALTSAARNEELDPVRADSVDAPPAPADAVRRRVRVDPRPASSPAAVRAQTAAAQT